VSSSSAAATVRIAQLWCYPLKSAAGIALDEARLTPAGLEADRSWMIVTPAGHFLTQREVPRLALISPALTADALQLRVRSAVLTVPLHADGSRIPVRIWKDSCLGIDAGDEAAAWLGRLLQRECRLVRFDPAQRRLSSRHWSGALEAENRFTDGFPLMVLSEASLAELNTRLQSPLPMNRFRPNIVLAGIDPYEEDRIGELSDGALRLRLVKPCTRCRITTTNQRTAEVEGDEPLRTLKSYRYDATLKGVLFGQNALVVAGAGSLLARGQSLQVSWKARAALSGA
jgi:MOSC domain-containing protein